jgi:hypothetical protein
LAVANGNDPSGDIDRLIQIFPPYKSQREKAKERRTTSQNEHKTTHTKTQLGLLFCINVAHLLHTMPVDTDAPAGGTHSPGVVQAC